MILFYTLTILLNICSIAHASQQKQTIDITHWQGNDVCTNRTRGILCSDEDLCSSCEYKQYPQRYTGCVFCRKPIKITDSLAFNSHDICANGVREAFSQAPDATQYYYYAGMNLFIRFVLSKHKISRKYLAASSDTKPFLNSEGENADPVGIYKGALQLDNGNLLHIWSKIKIEDQDKKVVTNWLEATEHADYVWGKYNVFGPETGTITFQSKPVNTSFTYEEIINKEEKQQ